MQSLFRVGSHDGFFIDLGSSDRSDSPGMANDDIFSSARFGDQEYEDFPNSFEVLGMLASQTHTQAHVRAHVMQNVVRHVFERGIEGAATIGPWVPTWSQVNAAKDQLDARCAFWGRTHVVDIVHR